MFCNTRRPILNELLAAVVAALVSATCIGPAFSADAATKKPNIVVIVADDLGYGEPGCYGGREIPTPNIDALAAGGVRLTSGYVSCPVCSPTRAGLMTGRYQQRFGHEFNPGPNRPDSREFGLPLNQTTLADLLKKNGYVTGMVGKWHLGVEKYHPLKRGFDEYFGFLGGAHSYINARADRANLILRGTEPVDEKEYLTDALSREAVSFIDRHKGDTFFLYLTFNAVHAPLQAPPKYLDRFANITDNRRRNFAAMFSALDDGVGAVVGKLRDAGLEQNTLIFFISDNGGPTLKTSSGNGPLSGYKGQVLEGGIRVPFLVQWKDHLPAGKAFDHPAIALDILPTSLAAAGVAVPKDLQIDGVDLLPHLAGKSENAPHDHLFWRFGEQAAVRKADWKLVRTPGESDRLYDLKADIGEKRNLADEKPEVLRDLQGAYAKWNGELVEPLWQKSGQPNRRAR